MQPLVILVALILGQAPCPPQVVLPLRQYSITYEGLDLVIEGRRQSDGQVRWETGHPFNAIAIKRARLAKANSKTKVDVTPVDEEDPRVASDVANEAARRDYTDRFGVRHVWPKRQPTAPQPIEEPDAPIGQAKSDFRTHGVQPHFMGNDNHRFTTDSDEGRRFVQELKGSAPAIDSIAGKIHVTVIGTEAERKKVMDDLENHPKLAPFKDAILVQGYDAGGWAVDPKLGFQPGTPAILIERGKTAADPKGGQVLWRATSYQEGPEKLAEELRKANPSYKPELDPGIAPGTSSSGCPLGFTAKHYPLIGIAIVALMWIFRHKKGPVSA